MTNIELLKFKLQEQTYPYFSDEDIDKLLDMYPNINQAAYEGCMLKSADDSVSLGPINTPNNSAYWLRLAKKYYRQWMNDTKKERGSGGYYSARRADEC